MNIKSLLLGSAAALFAVSGAQAADAIIAAAPEPVEYVRVCDAFGTGYYYIPGTETCISVGGRVRVQAGFGDLLGQDPAPAAGGAASTEETWNILTRAYLYLRSAADTEFGVLRTYTEAQWNLTNNTQGTLSNSADARLAFAYIQLGGLRVGKDESAYAYFAGYAGSVINDTIGVSYSPGALDVHTISYTYDAGNGFSGIVALEDDTRQGAGYIPDVVGGVAYDGGAFGVTLLGAYDESANDGAIKARVDASFGGFSAFLLGQVKPGGANRYATFGGDWAIIGGASAPLTERLTFNAQVGYDDAENFGAAANVSFAVADGFVVVPEIAYEDLVGQDDEWGGVIRFQRTF